MTTTSNILGSRILAAFGALLLSTAMVISSVGPAYNVPAVQSLVA